MLELRIDNEGIPRAQPKGQGERLKTRHRRFLRNKLRSLERRDDDKPKIDGVTTADDSPSSDDDVKSSLSAASLSTTTKSTASIASTTTSAFIASTTTGAAIVSTTTSSTLQSIPPTTTETTVQVTQTSSLIVQTLATHASDPPLPSSILKTTTLPSVRRIFSFHHL